MLDQVNLNQPDIDKGTYKETHDALIERLVTLQQKARLQGVGLVVLFEGWNGAGKGSRISDLMFNLDARATSVHVTGDFDVDDAQGLDATPSATDSQAKPPGASQAHWPSGVCWMWRASSVCCASASCCGAGRAWRRAAGCMHCWKAAMCRLFLLAMVWISWGMG